MIKLPRERKLKKVQDIPSRIGENIGVSFATEEGVTAVRCEASIDVDHSKGKVRELAI
jgi:hypothetical protein